MIRQYHRFAAATLALVLVGATGVCQGVWTGRWRTPLDVTPMLGRLDRVPITLGEWEGHEAALDQNEVASSGVSGSWMRKYENRSNGERVTVLMVAGLPGPVSVHSPDVCYPASGYEPDGSADRRTMPLRDGRTAEFWAADFRKESAPVPARLRVLWAWGHQGQWSAPLSPRLAFAREGVLYKLYVVRPLPLAGDGDGRDASADFLEAFLPEVAKVMTQ